MTKREFAFMMVGFFICHAAYLLIFHEQSEELLPAQIRIIEFTPTPFYEEPQLGSTSA